MSPSKVFHHSIVILGFVILISVPESHCAVSITPKAAYNKPSGDNILATCAYDGPKQRIRWLNPANEEIFSSQGIGDDSNSQSPYIEVIDESVSLFIPEIQTEGAGNYTCEVITANGDTETDVFPITVLVKIKFINSSLNHHALLGSSYFIRCDARSIPPARTFWHKGPKKITNSDKYELKDDGLLIRNVQQSDAGKYTCHARIQSEVMSDFKRLKIELNTQNVPRCNFRDNVFSSKNSTISLSCRASGDGPFKYQWFENDMHVDGFGPMQISNDSSSSKLQFTPTGLEDSSNISCVASNEVGTCSYQINLHKPNPEDFEISRNSDGKYVVKHLRYRSQEGVNGAVVVDPDIRIKLQYKTNNQSWDEAENVEIKMSEKPIDVKFLEKDKKYSIRVAFGTPLGYGNFSSVINHEPVAEVNSAMLPSVSKLTILCFFILHLIYP